MAPPHQLLKDKVAIVTGADTVIGNAIAVNFVKHGAIVFLAAAGKDVKSCQTLADEVNGYREKPVATTGVAKPLMDCEDVSNWDSFCRAVEEVRICPDNTNKNLDIFYCHAEFFNRVFCDGSGIFKRSTEDNVKSALDLVGSVMGKNKDQGGCILYASSTMGTLGDAMTLANGISQTAATGVVRAKAAELATKNVRVNAISQGSADWRMLKSIFPRANEEQLKQMCDNYMMAKPKPDDMADVAVFLASDYGKSVTGHNLLPTSKL